MNGEPITETRAKGPDHCKSDHTMRVSGFMTQDPPSGPMSAPISAAAPELLCAGSFVSEEQLARLVEAGAAVRAGAVLMAKSGERFALQDALRILGVEPGKTDPYGLTGRVASLTSWLERGFVLYAARVALGRHLYDIELGVILHPLGDADRSGRHSAAFGSGESRTPRSSKPSTQPSGRRE